MSGLIISIIVILLVIFLIIAMQGFMNKSKMMLTTSADDNIECRLRLIMLKNPNVEIYVINKTGSEEIQNILIHLQKDFPNIHIKENLQT